MIQEISVKDLSPHPDNPRGDNLGDLAELAESIKARGVLQNLTVVPLAGTGIYRIVIGHRRLAAAKLAGLETVPCAIVEMDPKEQLGTMLLENLARADLTIPEQAAGFQMMIDLGATIPEIVEKTGFSESTVRHRLKIAELPRDAVEKGIAKGATIGDYIKLEKLTDPENKKFVLDYIGSPNFDYWCNERIRKEAAERNAPRIRAFLENQGILPFPKNEEAWKYTRLEHHIDIDDDFDAEQEADEIPTEAVYYTEGSGTRWYLYGNKMEKFSQSGITADDVKKAQQEKADAADRAAKLDEICRQMYTLRLEFVRTVPMRALDRNKNEIFQAAICCMDIEEYSAGEPNTEIFADLYKWDEEKRELHEEEDTPISTLVEEVQSGWIHGLFLMVYLVIDDQENVWHKSWGGDGRALFQKRDYSQTDVYAFLGKFGYEMSDVERQIVDGTHPLYTLVAKKEEDAEGV
ncbi:MAG: ParB/RepB/Spo0J family partition protein [Clostridiales bacterium]|nr:ParB/RepB/Spo0J family partition protein [Clostridiales bacterium]